MKKGKNELKRLKEMKKYSKKEGNKEETKNDSQKREGKNKMKEKKSFKRSTHECYFSWKKSYKYGLGASC